MLQLGQQRMSIEWWDNPSTKPNLPVEHAPYCKNVSRWSAVIFHKISTKPKPSHVLQLPYGKDTCTTWVVLPEGKAVHAIHQKGSGAIDKARRHDFLLPCNFGLIQLHLISASYKRIFRVNQNRRWLDYLVATSIFARGVQVFVNNNTYFRRSWTANAAVENH